MGSHTRPQASDARPSVLVVWLVIALVVYNNLIGGVIDAAWYVPVNLALGAALLAGARRLGFGPKDLGLEADRAPEGLKWGLIVVGLAVVVLAVGLAVPFVRPVFEDERAAGIGYGLLAYRTLIRIPLGTAVLEEVAFRGVLLGAWLRRDRSWVAVTGSSAIFGLWHIRPAWEMLSENGLAEAPGPRWLVVAAAVVGTALAGAALSWLRLRSGSLLAPLVAHAGINSFAFLAAYIALRMA